MNRPHTFYLFLFACIFSAASAKFDIVMPMEFKNWWDNNPQSTHTSIASFGDIPWGKKIMGRLGLAKPLEACSYIELDDDAHHVPPILVAVRGYCPFYLKAHYAQLAGAKLLLIVDNQYEEVEAKLMVDSAGQGESIHIASALLAKQGGDKIIESLQNDNKAVSHIMGSFDFSLQKGDEVEYHLWLSSSSAQSFRFLKDWKQYQDKLTNVADMEAHYGHFRTFGNEQDSNENCLCRGSYCSTDPDGDLPNTGADVVLEDLRQMCIKKEYSIDAWWQYILTYEVSCLTGGDMKTCSHNIMSRINVDPEDIEWCVKRSFDSQDPKTCYNNSMLESEQEVLNRDGAFLFPSVIINGFTYRGNLVPARGVFETICESFNNMPDVCNTHFSEVAVAPQITTNHIPTVIAAIAFLIIFALFVFCCYRRYLMREMYKQGVREVNMAVSQYIAFRDNEADKETE